MWTSCERSSSRVIETTINGNGGGGASETGGSGPNVRCPGSSQHETLADIERISTIAGSLVSIGSISHTQPRYGTNDAGYDTEHTSLNSDFDEAELRRELLRDKWKLLFDMFDPEGFGEITVNEFTSALKSPEFVSQVPMNKRELLLERAKKAKSPTGPGYITFQDFVNVIRVTRPHFPAIMTSLLQNPTTVFDENTKIWHGNRVQSLCCPQDSIGAIVLSSLLKHPDHVTQICFPSGKSYSNREIAALSIRVALNLQKLGFRQAEVIGMCVENSDFVAPLVFGALLCGLSISTADPSFDKRRLAHIFSITRPKLMFCDGEIYQKVKAAFDLIDLANTNIYTVSNHIDNAPSCRDFMKYCPGENVYKAPDLVGGINQTALILCSSGTTGLPKAVTLSHASMLCIRNETSPKLHTTLCFSSLLWYSGVSSLIHGTIRCDTRVISSRPFTPDDFIDIVETYKVNCVITTPSQMSMTMSSKRIHNCDLSSILLYLLGGCAVPSNFVKKFQNYAKNAKFFIFYGMSEVCGAISFQEIDAKESVGQLKDNVEVKIISDHGDSLNKNEVGEICIRTQWPWDGYYNDPEATNRIYDAERWIKSGDIGYFDKEGFLYINDRKKDIFKYNGYQIYPTEIERVIMELTDVLEVCVVGIPDIAFMFLPAAAVVRKKQSSLSEEDICVHVASRMQHFEQLRGGVYFLDSLPHTVTGKPLRRATVEICQKRQRGEVDYM